MNNLIGFKNIELYPNFILSEVDNYGFDTLKNLFSFFYCNLNVYDRFNKLPTIFDNEINWKYNLDGKCKKTIEEICVDEATELSNNYDKIFISFSGGISSLAILSAFALANKLDKIFLIHDENFENKNILEDWFKSNNVKHDIFGYENGMNSFSQIVKNNISDNEKFCIVNGMCADQLSFGRCRFNNKFDEFINPKTNEKVEITDPYEFVFEEPKEYEFVHEWISKFSFGDKIKNIHHMSWFFNFAIKWTALEFRYTFLYDTFMPSVHKTFFATQEFTDWCINNLDVILDGKPWLNDKKNYKAELKPIIEHVFGDSFEYVNKKRRLNFVEQRSDFKNKYARTNFNYIDENTKSNVFATDGKKFYSIDLVNLTNA